MTFYKKTMEHPILQAASEAQVGVRGFPERDISSLGVMGWGGGGMRKFFRCRRRRRRRPPKVGFW